ncbi:MAG: hypothetical protein AABW79_00485 [Nanoarchaeota archaeon]
MGLSEFRELINDKKSRNMIIRGIIGTTILAGGGGVATYLLVDSSRIDLIYHKDINGDGREDIVNQSGSKSRPAYEVFLQEGNGEFVRSYRFSGKEITSKLSGK